MALNDKGIVKVEDAFYILPDAKALVEITQSSIYDQTFGIRQSRPTLLAGRRVARWGANNLKPFEMLDLISKNHLKPRLLETERDFLLGKRTGVYKIQFDEGSKSHQVIPVQDNQMMDAFEELEGAKFMRRAAYNYVFSRNYFANVSLNKFKKVDGLQCFDCTDMRAEQISKGRIENYFFNPDWRLLRQSDIIDIPAFDRRNPTKYGEFIYHGRDEMVGQTYYAWPSWWGTENWTKISNLIPQFHISGLTNGYNIKYHIKIPRDYFKQFGDETKQIAAEKALTESMNEFLSGVKNVNKAFISKFATDQTGKPIPGFEIIPFNTNDNSTAYIELDKQANLNHGSGHGVDPTIVGIDTGSKLGGSGSEARIKYQMHIALRTPTPRAILLEVFNNVIKPINGFNKDHFYGIEDVDITTLDQSKTGQLPPTNKTS